ncbi:hypothetical protein JKA74_03810 [Marivirga sp. S37H4]|uniref:Uncharacterized protein n=1 Tax=Marivirga aurantiaca TaxID=2802615 RepID=A0A934WWB7_9BACT|nr:hypothetical protein [Marivirga aurantiaca]MBK6264152.1 hypothetical protein [Marivirga aurantiaca]
MRIKIFWVLIFIAGHWAEAQEIRPKGQFLQDSMALGEKVQFSLSVSYPLDQQLLFPDSTYNFYPFEFRSKTYFPTRTDSLMSYDSAVFTLASYEIEELQTLRLPVFVIQGKDSLRRFTSVDSIFLQEMIPIVSDTLSLKTDTNLAVTDKEFNYPLLIAIVIVILILIVLIIVFFGKKIRLKWKIWQLERKHRKFLEQFKPQAEHPQVDEVEKLLFRWKNHLEKISLKPYAKLTTKEIHSLHQDEDLYQNLKQMDRSIYSSAKNDNLSAAFEFLIGYADYIFNERIKELQAHAK